MSEYQAGFNAGKEAYENKICLLALLDLFDNWNINLVINDRELNLYARVSLNNLKVENYKTAMTAKVLAFGFYDGELCVSVDI